ncbi:rod shape-determining protein MreC [Schlesneria sp. DSM 10557]|uniref:rod shape-determining protein MreC n=1 Tax=Schlesneria sp. DSM 10557 TaxID=3044399 RepID=UPI00359F3080
MATRSVMTCCCLLLTGIGLYFAPEGLTTVVRARVMDVLRPAFVAVNHVANSLGLRPFEPSAGAGDRADGPLVAKLTEELDDERANNRALQLRLAQLTERLAAEDEIYSAINQTKRLVSPALTEVAVLGDVVAEQWRAGKFLAQGANQGLRENELVISNRKPLRPLVDGGEDFGISAEDKMLLGRCVIGKIETVGQWTSTFQLVTDSRYRGRAQLIRETDSGFVFEAQGILKGQGGPLCKLEGIPAEKSVRLNDAVYTADRDGVVPTPFYYGRVVEAELGPDDHEWTVLVRPAPLPAQLTTVQVLRIEANPERLVVR